MSHHDPISDYLTRIRNALMQKHKYVDVMLSNLNHSIAKVMEEQGFIAQVMMNKEKRALRLFLKYGPGLNPVMQGLRRISKPGVRRYIGHREIPRVLGGMGIAIVSTSQGILEGEQARTSKLGGELLCYIW